MIIRYEIHVPHVTVSVILCGGTHSPTLRGVQAKRAQNLVREREVVPEARDKVVRLASNEKMEGSLYRKNSGFIRESSRQL